MIRAARCRALTMAGAVVFAVAMPARAVTVRMVAVALNDTPLSAPADRIDAVPGDRIEVEFHVSGWGTELDHLKTWQVTVNNLDVVQSNEPAHCGGVAPLYYDDPFIALRNNGAFASATVVGYGVCSDESDLPGVHCVSRLSTCTGTCIGNICSQDSTNAGAMCSNVEDQCPGGTCVTRADYLFADQNSICATDVSNPDYRFGCTVLLDDGVVDPSACVSGSNAGGPCESDADCPGGTCHLVEFYGGTVILEVGDNARGTYHYGVLTGEATFFKDGNPAATVHSVPLEIRVLGDTCSSAATGACCVSVGDCQLVDASTCAKLGGAFRGESTACDGWCTCPELVSTDPPNCANDARYPYAPHSDAIADPIGFDAVDLTFASSDSLDLLTAEDFVFTELPGASPLPPAVESIELLGGNSVRVHFDRPFTELVWSCLGLACAGPQDVAACWGHLPADVDDSGAAGPSDILAIVDALTGVTTLPSYRCDIDDSGACVASDVLAVIDLLNGAGSFEPYLNVDHPVACPTAR